MQAGLKLVLASMALAGSAGTLTAQKPATKAQSAHTAQRDTAHADPFAARSMGSASAPVTVYEMSDFQCPFCRRHAIETFPILEREYIATGKVRWIFLNFPLTGRHPNAAAAAQFAMCAANEGKFWPVHDLLYKYQDTWAPLKDPGAFLMTLADSVHVPRPVMVACLQDPASRQAVERDAQGAARTGATATPSFYIEGGIMAGAYPVDVFRQVLDSVYKVKTAGKVK